MTTANTELSSTVLSVFAIVILSILAGLYRSGHEEFVGGVHDPDDGKAVAATIFIAVLVYVVCALHAPPPSLFRFLEKDPPASYFILQGIFKRSLTACF
ncbi:hypothetical protein ACJZ2D_005826 [Fusarium nematophilum]